MATVQDRPLGWVRQVSFNERAERMRLQRIALAGTQEGLHKMRPLTVTTSNKTRSMGDTNKKATASNNTTTNRATDEARDIKGLEEEVKDLRTMSNTLSLKWSTLETVQKRQETAASALREDVDRISRVSSGTTETRVVTLENSVAALRNSFEEWTKDIMKELRNLDERISVSSADAQQERDRQPSNAVQTLQVLESRVDEMGAVVQKVHETTFSTIVEALEDLSIDRQERSGAPCQLACE